MELISPKKFMIDSNGELTGTTPIFSATVPNALNAPIRITPPSTLLDFIQQSLRTNYSPRHSRLLLENFFKSAGGQRLSYQTHWKDLQPGKLYYSHHEAAAFCAFYVPSMEALQKTRPLVIATHHDFCRLDLISMRPTDASSKQGYRTYPMRIYGSPKLHTWMDRPLGCTVFLNYTYPAANTNNEVLQGNMLLTFPENMFTIPSVAIHFHMDGRIGDWKLDPDKDLAAIYSERNEHDTFEVRVREAFNAEFKRLHHDLIVPGNTAWEIIQQTAAITTFVAEEPNFHGHNYFCGSRMDDALLTFTVAQAFAGAIMSVAPPKVVRPVIFAAFNHEEIGSKSNEGAGGGLLRTLLQRLPYAYSMPEPDPLTFVRQIFLVSSDVTHAQHPNQTALLGAGTPPLMNDGPIFSTNSHDSQAMSTAGLFSVADLARRHGIPIQTLEMKNDRPCGHTIGPILSEQLGVAAVELGVGMWGMHSARETVGVKDIKNICSLYMALMQDTVTAHPDWGGELEGH